MQKHEKCMYCILHNMLSGLFTFCTEVKTTALQQKQVRSSLISYRSVGLCADQEEYPHFFSPSPTSSCYSTTAFPPLLSSVSWKTALILDYRTEPTDRFMWAQEGRLCPVISAVKSPVGLHWPAGEKGCVRVF